MEDKRKRWEKKQEDYKKQYKLEKGDTNEKKRGIEAWKWEDNEIRQSRKMKQVRQGEKIRIGLRSERDIDRKS
jgi:hypothetical protein